MVRRAISGALAPSVWKTLEDLCSTRPVPMAGAPRHTADGGEARLPIVAACPLSFRVSSR